MTTDILLGVVAGLLLFGFIGVASLLVEIRDELQEIRHCNKRIADEIVEDD